MIVDFRVQLLKLKNHGHLCIDIFGYKSPS